VTTADFGQAMKFECGAIHVSVTNFEDTTGEEGPAEGRRCGAIGTLEIIHR
jgi:hypothetical protein